MEKGGAKYDSAKCGANARVALKGLSHVITGNCAIMLQSKLLW